MPPLQRLSQCQCDFLRIWDFLPGPDGCSAEPEKTKAMLKLNRLPVSLDLSPDHLLSSAQHCFSTCCHPDIDISCVLKTVSLYILRWIFVSKMVSHLVSCITPSISTIQEMCSLMITASSTEDMVLLYTQSWVHKLNKLQLLLNFIFILLNISYNEALLELCIRSSLETWN